MLLLLFMLSNALQVACNIENWSFNAHNSSKLQSILGYPIRYSSNMHTWTGGDAATSIKISDDTYIWLFGDSFVSNYNNTNNINQRFNASQTHKKSCNPWPHSTIALHNISSNKYMKFYIQSFNNSPSSFFQPNSSNNDDINSYWWVVSGIADQNTQQILLLAANILCSNTSLGFSINNTVIIVVDNYTQNINNPLQWNYEYKNVENSNSTLNWFAGISYTHSTNDHVYWFGTMKNNVNCIAKVSLNELMSFQFDNVVYYGYDNNHILGWYSWQNVASLQWIIDKQYGSSEITVLYNNVLQSWYLFYIAFGATKVQLYVSDNSSIISDYHSLYIYDLPYPSNDTNLYFCYATKSHPQLAFGGNSHNQLVFTYVCNAWTVNILFQPGNATVYIPQFVVVNVTKLESNHMSSKNHVWYIVAICFVLFIAVCLMIGYFIKKHKKTETNNAATKYIKLDH